MHFGLLVATSPLRVRPSWAETRPCPKRRHLRVTAGGVWTSGFPFFDTNSAVENEQCLMDSPNFFGAWFPSKPQFGGSFEHTVLAGFDNKGFSCSVTNSNSSYGDLQAALGHAASRPCLKRQKDDSRAADAARCTICPSRFASGFEHSATEVDKARNSLLCSTQPQVTELMLHQRIPK